ncbi:transcription antitermination factor NusB [Blautia sp. HCP3S3_G3]|uniref:transcription antitermination factor NusB n=1 Tax=Blautia sp. HCP3S3_G3 TaxID=3438913 RepID=UPI003F8CA51A
MKRREQREHVFKLLFMTQFNSENEMTEQVNLYFEGLEEPDDKSRIAIQEQYSSVLAHLEEIDGVLNEYSRGWKTDRMNRVDLSALRLAVYEMKYEEDVPVGVAINEAVEIAKCFGGETSGSFVNGVLGKIASGRKDDAEEHKAPVRKEHRAKHIIINKADKEKKQTADTAAEVE